MAAKLLEISDAVVVSINAASLSIAFTATRSDRPPIKLTELAADSGPRVYVLPGAVSQTRSPQSRAMKRTLDYQIDILILRKDATSSNNHDQYHALVEEIENHLSTAGRMSDATWLGATIDPHYSAELYDSHQVFAAVSRQQYRLIK